MKLRINKTTATVLVAAIVGWSAPVYGFTRVAPEYLSRSYQPDIVYDAAKSGGLLVEVVGQGTAQSGDLAQRTVSAIQNSRLGKATPLRLSTELDDGNGPKLVVVFEPAVGTGYLDACQGTSEAQHGSLDRVMLTLCDGGTAVSSVTAINGDVTDADSPAFAAMLQRAATTVFQVRGGDMRGQGFWNHRGRRAQH